jgi:hypothetical protein
LYPDFERECIVTANLQNIRGLVKLINPLTREPFWVIKFQIGIKFGGTQLSAFIEWEENVRQVLLFSCDQMLKHEQGKTMTGPATVIPQGLV